MVAIKTARKGNIKLLTSVEGVIPVEGNMANVATTAEFYAERTAQCCTNKNKNAPEEWCIHAKRIKC